MRIARIVPRAQAADADRAGRMLFLAVCAPAAARCGTGSTRAVCARIDARFDRAHCARLRHDRDAWYFNAGAARAWLTNRQCRAPGKPSAAFASSFPDTNDGKTVSRDWWTRWEPRAIESAGPRIVPGDTQAHRSCICFSLTARRALHVRGAVLWRTAGLRPRMPADAPAARTEIRRGLCRVSRRRFERRVPTCVP